MSDAIRVVGTIGDGGTVTGWPPTDVVVLCANGYCGRISVETGFCAKCERDLIRAFKGELFTLDAVAFAPAEWFQVQMDRYRHALHGWPISLEQARLFKLALAAEFHPATALNRIPAEELAALADGRMPGDFFTNLPGRIQCGMVPAPKARKPVALEMAVAMAAISFLAGVLVGGWR
jgi:hypothetical protein